MPLMLLFSGRTVFELPAATPANTSESPVFAAREWLSLVLFPLAATGLQVAADLAPPGHQAAGRRRQARAFAPRPAVIEFNRPTGETDF